MAVYKRNYKVYDGPQTPSRRRFLVLTRFGLRTLFQSRLFVAYTVACFVPFLVGSTFIYFVHSTTAQLALNLHFGRVLIDRAWFTGFLGVEAWMAVILVAWGAPGMITRDLANSALQLYLSRPISRAEYMLGKISVLGLLLSCTTWVPAVVLFLLQASLQGGGWGWEHLWMLGSIMLGCLLWIAIISLYSLALSVWVKWRIAATALFLGSFFVFSGFGEVVNLILRTNWGKLLNIPYVFMVVWSHLFRFPQDDLHLGQLDLIPLWAAWAALLAICAVSLWLLNTRLKAREVERT